MLKIRKPNDFHHHLREKELLKLTTKNCFDKFHHVIVMPNLIRPIITIRQALNYRKQILELDNRGNPLMTLYLHPNIPKEDLYDFQATYCAPLQLPPVGSSPAVAKDRVLDGKHR